MNSERLRLALQWRDDIERGDMIQRQGYKPTHLFFVGEVKMEEFAAICDAANTFYKGVGSPLRMRPEMGEIRPYIEGEKQHHVGPVHNVVRKVPSR
jgi:hypothetical protein